MKKGIKLLMMGVIGAFCLPMAVNAEATITVCDSDCDYTTLADAVAAASAGDTIKLESDLALTSTVTVDKNITIDLNGNKITMNGAQYVLAFDSKGGEFTLTDSATTPGSIINNTESDSRGILVTNGTLTFDKITVESAARVIQVNPVDGDNTSSATVIMNGGTLKANGTTTNVRAVMLWGNNVSMESARFTMNGGEIIAPISSKNSTGINIGNAGGAGAAARMNGGKITAYNGVRLYGNDQDDMTIFIMNDGEIEAASSGVLQSTADGTGKTQIHILGGTITAHDMEGSAEVGGDAVAIYHGQYGTLVIGYDKGGPTITGETAISIKEGNVTINGGTITATGAYRDPATARNDGTDDTGAAISITSNDNYNEGIRLVINGGTLISENGNALYEGIAELGGVPAATTTYVNEIKVSGGTFTGADDQESVVVREYAEKFITDGVFSSDVNEYAKDGVTFVTDTNGNYTTGTPTTPEEEVPNTFDGASVAVTSLCVAIIGLAIALIYTKKTYNM